MSDPNPDDRSLRERLSGTTEDRLGRALSDLLENTLLNGAIGRAFDAREKAAQAQEVAMGALNIPSAADIERLTRRLRSVSQRLEGIEDGVQRLDRALSSHGVEERLSSIEEKLGTLTEQLDEKARVAPERKAAATPAKKARAAPASKRSGSPRKRSRASAAGKGKPKKT